MFRNWFWGENVLFEGVGYLFVGIRAYRLAGWSLARDGGRGTVGHCHTRLHITPVYTAMRLHGLGLYTSSCKGAHVVEQFQVRRKLTLEFIWR